MSTGDARDATVGMLEAAGSCPAWIYAYDRTGGLLPLFDGSFATDRDRADWDAAIDEYVAENGPGVDVDRDAEIRKLRNVLVVVSMQTAASDPQYAAGLTARLGSVPPAEDGDTVLMSEYLHAGREELLNQLRSEPSVLDQACEYARAWAGAALAEQVRSAADSVADEDAPIGVLFAVAVASLTTNLAPGQ